MLYTTHRRNTKESVYVAAISRGMADGLLLSLPRNPEAYADMPCSWPLADRVRSARRAQAAQLGILVDADILRAGL